jgi:hypothetical protein
MRQGHYMESTRRFYNLEVVIAGFNFVGVAPWSSRGQMQSKVEGSAAGSVAVAPFPEVMQLF